MATRVEVELLVLEAVKPSAQDRTILNMIATQVQVLTTLKPFKAEHQQRP